MEEGGEGDLNADTRCNFFTAKNRISRDKRVFIGIGVNRANYRCRVAFFHRVATTSSSYPLPPPAKPTRPLPPLALRYFQPRLSLAQTQSRPHFSISPLFFHGCLFLGSPVGCAMQQHPGGPICRGNWVDIGNESEEQITAGFGRATCRETERERERGRLQVQRGSNSAFVRSRGSSALARGSAEHDFTALGSRWILHHPLLPSPGDSTSTLNLTDLDSR